MQKVIIYTDGACSGNPGPGGWAAVLMAGELKKEISGGQKNTTNNIMELTAIIQGLKALKQECEVEKLGSCLTAGLRIFSSKILSGNHRAAGGESRENIDDEQHDCVDQGNTGDGCLPDPGDHDGVGKTDGDL